MSQMPVRAGTGEGVGGVVGVGVGSADMGSLLSYEPAGAPGWCGSGSGGRGSGVPAHRRLGAGGTPCPGAGVPPSLREVP
ncbi:predicted protein [Streptomyces sp. SPB78]|nr:predicted protein [Streptomyces sp. SPB78]